MLKQHVYTLDYRTCFVGVRLFVCGLKRIILDGYPEFCELSLPSAVCVGANRRRNVLRSRCPQNTWLSLKECLRDDTMKPTTILALIVVLSVLRASMADLPIHCLHGQVTLVLFLVLCLAFPR